jgi:hypothetical protein
MSSEEFWVEEPCYAFSNSLESYLFEIIDSCSEKKKEFYVNDKYWEISWY